MTADAPVTGVGGGRVAARGVDDGETGERAARVTETARRSALPRRVFARGVVRLVKSRRLLT